MPVHVDGMRLRFEMTQTKHLTLRGYEYPSDTSIKYIPRVLFQDLMIAKPLVSLSFCHSVLESEVQGDKKLKRVTAGHFDLLFVETFLHNMGPR